ncbi:metallophosphoesterase family protein [Bacillus sp. FJAT-45350]|uniref:metallophosphoesterase family protein n=1 Tax=Bacillus sp. FJAT-45350 TaxID=2011014 RepID=UPI000BB8EF54|nr:DNA repair exonuclease [Bacillus sp. FJAT-45350]
MKSIKFIHTADLHLDSPFKGLRYLPDRIHSQVQESTFESFTRIVSYAIKEKVDFVLIAGDIYDGQDRSLKAQARFKKELVRLERENIKVYIIHGNHDHLSGNWVPIEWPSNVVFFSDDVECKRFEKDNGAIVHIYGFSYPTREVLERRVKQYEKVDEADFHIGMLHGQAEGNTEHASYAPFTVKELVEKGFNYWALGHIHQFQKLSSSILYPGNIQGRNKKEIGDKGCILAELTSYDLKTTFFPTAKIIWDEIEVDLSNLNSLQELMNTAEEKKEEQRRNDNGKIIIIKYFGRNRIHLPQKDELLEILNDGEEYRRDFVWVVDIENKSVTDWNREKLRQEEHVTGDIVNLVDRYKEDKAFHEEVCKEIMSHSKGKRFFEKFTSEDEQKIIEEAEDLILSTLVKEWEE